MRSTTFLQCGLVTLANLASAHPPIHGPRAVDSSLGQDPICVRIKAAISSASDVYYPGSILYNKDISHWATSSSDNAKCSVEPGTAADVGVILQILGETKTPFAVKGGGHASNPGFSSTTGVQIAMYRFSEVTYSASSQTAVVGAGLLWDDVYTALEKYNVNVVGGRVTGVGVAGFTLGGGYSWKTNQYGLTVDTVAAFELVKPSGEVVNVTDTVNPDLFFGLRGGFNNFGIVTKFTLKTFPQTQVWGGIMTFTQDHIKDVTAAVARFQSTVTDPKAGIITTFNFLLGQPGVTQILFYDAPTAPAGVFDEFLAIPSFSKDVSTRSFLSLVTSVPANATAGNRGTFHTVPSLTLNDAVLAAMVNETTFWGNKLAIDTGNFISYSAEPYLPSLYTHTTSTCKTAFPPTRPTSGTFPLFMYYSWAVQSKDDLFHDAILQSAAHLAGVVAQQKSVAPAADAMLYGNYARFGTPLEEIYGDNLPELRRIRGVVDPGKVMDLAGGWKF